MSVKIENPVLFRENIRKKLGLMIEDETLTTNLEKGIFNYAIKEANTRKIVKKWENPHFAQIYLDRLRSIYINLKNVELLTQIKNNEITPQKLAFMTHQELDPEHWREYIDRKIKRDASKFVNNIEASTDMYTCKKCKSKRCIYHEMQTRSADEATSVYVTCLDCGKMWRA